MDAQLTKQFPLTKTLRFELKPHGKTSKLLDNSGVIKIDEKRSEDFKKLKERLDDVYRHFIEDALERVDLPVAELSAFEIKENAKHATHMALRKHFLQAFNETNKAWQAKFELKKEALTSEAIIKVMQDILPDTVELAKQFERFTTYLGPFNENRQYMFKDEGKASQIATRAIEENLPIFLTNINRAQQLEAQNIEGLEEYAALFNIDEYGHYLSQRKIDAYNAAIGEINSVVNECRQIAEKSEKKKLPFLRPLYKQILSDRPAFVELLENDDQLIRTVSKLLEQADENSQLFEQITHTFFEGELDLSRVYVKRTALNSMANAWFGDWAFARNIAPKQSEQKHDAFVTVNTILQGLEAVEEKPAEIFNVSKKEIGNLMNTSGVSGDIFWRIWQDQLLLVKNQEFEKRQKAKALDEYKSDASKETLKDWLDARRSIEQMVRWWQLEYKREEVTELERDESFYLLLDRFYGTALEEGEQKAYIDFFDGYNKIRNYLTKKPYSLDKWKLNFDKGFLLKGWSESPEGNAQYNGYILRKDGKYFIAVTDYSRLLGSKNLPQEDGATYEQMEYRQLKVNTLTGSVYAGVFGSKYAADKAAQSDEFMISRIKELLAKYQSTFPEIAAILKQDFQSINDLIKYLSNRNFYALRFDKKIPAGFLEQGEYKIGKNACRLFVFEITNRDMTSKKIEGRNLHTHYFEHLFNQGILAQPIKFKLDGKAEIFFRPASLKAKEVSRNQKTGVIEHRRFTEDKVFLHLPIKINYGAVAPHNLEFNEFINAESRQKKPLRVIGIDRGEKHLAYVAICDENGKLIESPKSLNVLEGINYYELLTKRTKERDVSRKEWKAIQAIKDLKAGFVGHAAKYIADLAVQHNAFIALEDLNSGFKRGRLKIEHSNYQKFESALLHKLQYYVDKTLDANEPGGSANGIQWAPPKVEPGDIKGAQFGRVLFVKAAYTSAIDPITGFRRCFSLDEKMPLERVLAGIERLYFDQASKSYHFVFSWSNLANSVSVKSKNAYPTKEWTVTSDVNRLRFKKNAKNGGGEIEQLNPNTLLRKLFEGQGVDAESKDIKATLLAAKTTARFRKDFYFAFNLITQLRNSNSATDTDYILSPVVDGGFDSEKGYEGYDWNGDANGALSIARKGAIMLSHIRNSKPGEKLEWQKLNTDAAWDEWLTKT